MHPAYRDIRIRAGAPGWHSQGGVPRYCDFHPNCVGVYARHVALLRVQCQCCSREMLVASERDMFYVTSDPWLPKREGCSDPWEAIGPFHYGDAPYHDCHSGETMNVVPLEILQFWKREIPGDWARDPAYEFVLPALEQTVEL